MGVALAGGRRAAIAGARGPRRGTVAVHTQARKRRRARANLVCGVYGRATHAAPAAATPARGAVPGPPAAVPTGRGGAVVSARPRGLCVRRTLFHESRGCGKGRRASSRPAPCVAVPSGALREAAVEAGVRPTAQRPGAPGREGVPGREAPRRPRGVCIWAVSGPGFRRWRPKASGRSRPLRGLLRESVFFYLS